MLPRSRALVIIIGPSVAWATAAQPRCVATRVSRRVGEVVVLNHLVRDVQSTSLSTAPWPTDETARPAGVFVTRASPPPAVITDL